MATFSNEEEKKGVIVLVTWQLNDPVKSCSSVGYLKEGKSERVEGWREKTAETGVSVGRKKGRETWTDDGTEKERRRERSGRRRDDEYITYGGESRFESCAGSIVLLREAGRSLSLSHAALIAHRSLIYRVGGRDGEKERRKQRARRRRNREEEGAGFWKRKGDGQTGRARDVEEGRKTGMYFRQERRDDVRGVLVQGKATNFTFYRTKKESSIVYHIGRRMRATFFEHAGR